MKAGFPVLLAAAILVCATPLLAAKAHPDSGIVADAQGNIYFNDTGRGVAKLVVRERFSGHYLSMPLFAPFFCRLCSLLLP